MSLIDSISKKNCANSQKWRTFVAIIMFLCGIGTLLLGIYYLSEITEVPNCVNLVDEQLMNIDDLNNETDSEKEQVEQIVNNFGKIQVEIRGEVNIPGTYWISSDSRLGEIVELAGGLTSGADQEYVEKQLNLSQKLKDEQKILIPKKEEKELEELLNEFCMNNQELAEVSNVKKNEEIELSAENKESVLAGEECISINYASASELQNLTGVGEKTAQLIIEGRPYSKMSDLTNVKGIGETTLEKLENEICL